ncbi:hypothetical protein ACLK1Z_06735 [Escherichia coli]
MIKFLREEMGVKEVHLPEHCGIGIKPCSEERHQTSGSCQRSNTQLLTIVTSVTLVHKGDIMNFTEGAFKDWGYQLAREDLAVN